MIHIPDDQIEWKTVKYLKEPWQATDEEAEWQYELILPEPLASWDVFAKWEKERIYSMRKHLKYGEVLFDIGTEQGWCNLVYASMVGPENMVLIEPTYEFWANIKKTWDKNYDVPPLACYWGLFDNKTRDDYDKGFDIWEKADNEQIIDRNKYQYIHESTSDITHIELDKYVSETGIVPDAITMDTEGSCYLIVQGAEKTLKENNIKVWISVHPELMARDYKCAPDDLFKFMESLGYSKEFIAEEHEQYYYFWKD